MSWEIDKRDCVPRTDAVVLEIGFADLGLPRRPRRTKKSKGFAFHSLPGAARTGHIIDYKGPAFVSLKRRAAKEEAA